MEENLLKIQSDFCCLLVQCNPSGLAEFWTCEGQLLISNNGHIIILKKYNSLVWWLNKKRHNIKGDSLLREGTGNALLLSHLKGDAGVPELFVYLYKF